MTLSKDQLETIADKFAKDVVDAMDMDTLIQIAYDQLFEYYSECNADELKEEVVNHHCGDESEWDGYVEATQPAASEVQRDLYSEVVEYVNSGNDLWSN